MEIFDWERSSSWAHHKATIIPEVYIVGGSLALCSINDVISTHLQETIRLLPMDRLLAFSANHIMVYSFVVVEGADTASPPDALEITQPLWRLPLLEARADSSALSQGLSDQFTTQFILTTGAGVLNLVVPIATKKPPV
jgi:hypothetical protein